MNKYNTIGVDLAQNVINVCVDSAANKEQQNKELTRKKFAEFLANQKPGLVAFEACATAHYQSRVARRYGHQTKNIPAMAVAPLGQTIKLIKMMRLLSPKPKPLGDSKRPSSLLNKKCMQAIQRSCELLIQNRTVLSNHIRGLLMEFGLVIQRGFSSLHENIPLMLEDGENELPDFYR